MNTDTRIEHGNLVVKNCTIIGCLINGNSDKTIFDEVAAMDQSDMGVFFCENGDYMDYDFT